MDEVNYLMLLGDELGAVIIGCGKATPSLEVFNDDLCALVDTSDEWIRTRTGIESRHIAVDESTQALAHAASCNAMGIENDAFPGVSGIGYAQERIDPSSIDLVVFPTITSDTIVPSAAAALKRSLGLEEAIAFDINAACTGFIYGLCIAESMMAASHLSDASSGSQSGAMRRNKIDRALVVCSERLSRLTEWDERSTCVLFGDGAGAAVLEWREDEPGIISSYLQNDDDETNALTCMQDYTAPIPFTAEGIDKSSEDIDDACAQIDDLFGIEDIEVTQTVRQVIRMDGQTVFKFAGKAMASCVEKVVESAGLSLDDITLVVPHQANERIIKFAAKRLKMDMDRFQVSMAFTGNTSSSGVPMALADALVEGKLQKGDRAVLVAFGGGLTSGAILLQI